MICVLLGQRLGPDTDKKFLAIGCCHYDCSTLQFHQTLSSGINCTFIKNFFNSVIRNNLHPPHYSHSDKEHRERWRTWIRIKDWIGFFFALDCRQLSQDDGVETTSLGSEGLLEVTMM